MTFISSDTKSQYAGNGVLAPFPTGFSFLKNSHVKVVLSIPGYADEALAQDVDYTIAGAGVAEGGTVSYPKAGSGRSVLAIGQRLTIYLDPPAVQERVFNNSGDFDMKEIEAAFDHITMVARAIIERLGRTLAYPVSASEAEVGTPEQYIATVKENMALAQIAANASTTAMLAAQAAQAACEGAVVDAQALLAQVPGNAGPRLTALEASQGTQDTAITTLTAQVATASRAAKLITQPLCGGA